MQRSWAPPCLHYSVPLLGWYLGSPSNLPVFVARARSAGRLVGFGMAVPRTFQTQGWEGDGYIKSFMTVDASSRGLGIGVSLRVSLLTTLRRLGLPVLRFGEGIVENRSRLQADYASADYMTVDLGECPSASTFASGSVFTTNECRGSVLEGHTFLNAFDTCESTNWLSARPTRGSVELEARDFRRRAYFGVQDGAGTWRVVASVVLANFVTKNGGQTQVALIENATISSAATSVDIRELLAAIGAAMFPHGKGQVSFSNVSGLSWPLLAGAGFRRLPTRYSALLALPDKSHPAAKVEGTSIAVT